MMAKKAAKAAAEEVAPVETPEEEVPAEEAAPNEASAAPVEDATTTESSELDADTITNLMTGDEDDEEDLPVGEVEKPAAEEAAAPSEEEAPVTGSTPSEETPAAPEAAVTPPAAETQAPVEEPAPEAPVQPTLTPEQQQEERAKWRDDTVEALAIGQYALSEEQVDLLDTDPGKMLSRFAARVYLDSVENAAAAVMQLLPQALAQMNTQTTQSDKLKGQFFETWDKLNPEEHGSILGKLGTAYRTANPQATPDEFIRDVGASAMVALKIPFEEAVIPSAEPAANLTSAHKPLGPGVAPAPAGASGADNAFTQIAEEHLADDQ